MSISDEMREKLEAAFAPDTLDIEDESELHRGHAGYQEEKINDGSAFQIRVPSNENRSNYLTTPAVLSSLRTGIPCRQ